MGKTTKFLYDSDDFEIVNWDGYRFPMPREIADKLLSIQQDLVQQQKQERLEREPEQPQRQEPAPHTFQKKRFNTRLSQHPDA